MKKLLALILAAALLAGCAPAAVIPDDKPTAQTPAETQSGESAQAFALVATERPQSDGRPQIYDDADVSAVAKKIVAFSGELTSLGAEQGENLVMSPFSVYIALACASVGAEGAAYEQIKAALYPDGMDDAAFRAACGKLLDYLTYDEPMTEEEQEYGTDPQKTLKLEIATLLCADRQYTINADFAQAAKQYFLGDTATADFTDPAATDAINGWANDATHGLVPQLFSEPIDAATVLMIANSVYFEGKWQWEFDKNDTREDVFHGAAGDGKAQFMMHDGSQQYADTELAQAVLLPYYGGAYMEVYLPHEDVGLAEVMAALNSGGLKAGFEQASGLLKLPKFTVESSIALNDALKQLGMTAMFEGGLTKMTDETELLVSGVLQKAKIEVDELGTKAAAVTVMMMEETGALVESGTPFEMIVDRPFAYRICTWTGETPTVLFVGCVNDIA